MPVLRGRLRELANERRRFGYRRLFVLLRREGEPSGINRIYRLDRAEGLTVRKRKARRKVVGTRAPILVEVRPNALCSLDFFHDQFANSPRFWVLNVVDDVTRESLAAIPDTSISGRRVARELTALIERRGTPEMIVSDNGTELTSNAILVGSEQRLCGHFREAAIAMDRGWGPQDVGDPCDDQGPESRSRARIFQMLCPQPQSMGKIASPEVSFRRQRARRPSVFMWRISGSIALRRRSCAFSPGVRPRRMPESSTCVPRSRWRGWGGCR